MKKVILIAFAFLLMSTGATVGVMKWMKYGPFAEKANGQTAVKAPPPAEPKFIDMDPLVISLFDADKLAGTLQIVIKLETLTDANAILVQRQLPRVNDAFLRDLHGFIPRHLRGAERIDLIVLKDRLQMVADKVLGPKVVTNVLVQSVTDTAARGG